MKPLELIFQNRINIKQFSEELCKKLEIYCQDFYKKNIENVVSQRIDDDLYSLIKQKDQSRDSLASHSIDVYCKDGKSYIMDFEFKNQKQCNIYWSGSLAYFFLGITIIVQIWVLK